MYNNYQQYLQHYIKKNKIKIIQRQQSIQKHQYPRMFNRQPIRTYLTGRQITNSNQLPIQFKERTGTDTFCTVVTAIFALALFITACIQFNLENLKNMTYPTDGMGRKCTLDNPKFNFLYFASITDTTRRVCVQQCPKANQQSLKCWPTDEIGCSKNNNPQFQVLIYDSQQEQTKLGLFCVPTDQKIKQQILRNNQLANRFEFIRYKQTLLISGGIAFVLGIIYLICLKFMARPMVYISVIGGGISCIVSGVFILINISKFTNYFQIWIIILCIVLILFGIFLLVAAIRRRNDLKLCAEYVDNAMKTLTNEPVLLLLIPVFLVLMVGLIALCGFQIFAYWSNSELFFHQEHIYYEPRGKFVEILKILAVIELVWGFFFLKEAFAFIVAGCGVTYYFKQTSYIMFGIRGLFQYHWGSVVAGSFLANFFYIPDLLYDTIKPNDQYSSVGRTFQKICCCCDRVLGFIRSQAVGFINIVGLPYCNSARWCQKINYHSVYFDGSQSINRYYRIGGHMFLSLLATLIAFISDILSGNLHPVGLAFSLLINFFIVTYFICLAGDLAETLLICRLTEQYIHGENLRSTPFLGNKNKNQEQSDVDNGYDIVPTQGNQRN